MQPILPAETDSRPRILTAPPKILPVDQSVAERPLWSVMIPAYNCSDQLPGAILSVLAQAGTPEEMQIMVVDDGSTDADVKSLVSSIGGNRVGYYRQPENRGSLINFETCIKLATGRLVHILHGDDEVKAGYYDTVTSLFEKFPQAGAAFTSLETIDSRGRVIGRPAPYQLEEGIMPDVHEQLLHRNIMQYCCVTVRREAYEKLGGFYGVIYGEDWEMWARIARKYPFAYSPKPLARYRELNQGSISSNSFMKGNNIADVFFVTDKITDHLPAKEKERTMLQARRQYLLWAVDTAYGWYRWHKKEGKLTLNFFKTVLAHTQDAAIKAAVRKYKLKMFAIKQFRQLRA